jgi:hypothetical protein
MYSVLYILTELFYKDFSGKIPAVFVVVLHPVSTTVYVDSHG